MSITFCIDLKQLNISYPTTSHEVFSENDTGRNIICLALRDMGLICVHEYDDELELQSKVDLLRHYLNFKLVGIPSGALFQVSNLSLTGVVQLYSVDIIF